MFPRVYNSPVPPAPVIFDLDDTLIESFPTYARIHQQVAGELGWPVPTREDLIAYGRSWEDTLAALWPGRAIDTFVRRYDEIAEAHPYPSIAGAEGALQELRDRGHAIYIVTKRTKRRLHLRLQQARLSVALFDGIFAAEDQPELKPSPACFAPVWQACGARHPGAVYVGDRHEDRRAAEAAGIGFLAVLTGPEVARGFPGDLPPERVLPTVAAVPDRLSAVSVAKSY